MRRQAQVTRANRQAHATEIFQAHDVPQAKPDVKATIGQASDAACQQHISRAFAPRSQVGARCFVKQHPHHGHHLAKLPTALQISLDNAGQINRGSIGPFEWRNGKRYLRETHA